MASEALQTIVQVEPALDKAAKHRDLPFPLVNGETCSSKILSAHQGLSAVVDVLDLVQHWQATFCSWQQAVLVLCEHAIC